MNESKTYSIDQASELLGVSRTHLYDLVKIDPEWSRLAIRLGRRVVLPRAAIDEMIARRLVA